MFVCGGGGVNFLSSVYFIYKIYIIYNINNINIISGKKKKKIIILFIFFSLYWEIKAELVAGLNVKLIAATMANKRIKAATKNHKR